MPVVLLEYIMVEEI